MPGFGAEIGRLMGEKGMVQKTLAEAIGVNQTFVGKLIRGEQTRLGADVLYKLCDALGVGCDHFRPFLSGDEMAAETEPPAKKGSAQKKGKKK